MYSAHLLHLLGLKIIQVCRYYVFCPSVYSENDLKSLYSKINDLFIGRHSSQREDSHCV